MKTTSGRSSRRQRAARMWCFWSARGAAGTIRQSSKEVLCRNRTLWIRRGRSLSVALRCRIGNDSRRRGCFILGTGGRFFVPLRLLLHYNERYSEVHRFVVQGGRCLWGIVFWRLAG